MKKMNNKGAALISVLVAVVFVSIVATTLLTISLNNYQMKVEKNRANQNFYETENDINVITLNVRNKIAGSTGDPQADVVNLVKNNSDSTKYSGEKLARLVYPSPYTGASVSGGYKIYDGDNEYLFKDGGADSINIETKPAGSIVTLKGITVTHINNVDKHTNTVKTDISFYIKKEQPNSADVTVGDCSFLLDNTVSFSGSSPTRTNIYGCCVIGKYNADQMVRVSVNAQNKVTSSNGACVIIGGSSCINFLAPYTIVAGDIYLSSKAVLNVYKGTFIVLGNIYIQDSAAFVCNANLKMGPNSYIYKVGSDGSLTKLNEKDVTGSGTSEKITDRANQGANTNYWPNLRKSNNAPVSSIAYLNTTEYTNTLAKINLGDSNNSNDGILNKILKKQDGQYCYELNKDDQQKDNYVLKFHGDKYYVQVPDADLNGKYFNSLLFVSDNFPATLAETAPNSTIISHKPVQMAQQHNISLSQIGPDVFNYHLETAYDSNTSNDTKFKVKDKNYSVKEFVVGKFFDQNCNSSLMDLFTTALGDTGESTGSSDNGVIYQNWERL